MTQPSIAPSASGPEQFSGLTGAEARHRLRQEGPNELPRREHRGLLYTVVEVVREPMIVLLLLAGGLYLFLGNHEEAILLLASIALIIAIELYQERRTEHALEALRGERWFGTTSLFWVRVTACLPTRCCSRPPMFRPMNRS
jgi:Ca2+-transporting ATPase